MVRDLERLEPCGEGNRAPRLLLSRVVVASAKNLKGHLDAVFEGGGRSVRGFAFDMGGRARELFAKTVNVVGLLQSDAYRGGDAVQVRVERVVEST